ncbi:hypothetical protein OH77DRAFT_188569 [Trametes cingulata]|nr:hypothetical protein OH77DRAFT_188569 [Trametes cingulata]
MSFLFEPTTNSRRNTSARRGFHCGTRWPAPWKKTYVRLRSWYTIPAKFKPSSSNQGVEGLRVKPWMPPKAKFWMATSVPRCCTWESSLPE